jgi:hypothetical protein
MPPRKKKFALNPGLKRQLAVFLKNQGLSDKEIISATREIEKRVGLGLTSAPEVVSEYLAEHNEKKTAKRIKELDRENKKKQKEVKAKIKTSKPIESKAKLLTGVAPVEVEKNLEEISKPAEEKPSATNRTLDPNTEKRIGILESLLEQQKKIGGEDTELSRAVLGEGDKKGIRIQIEELVKQNRERIGDLEDPNNAANFEVIEEALALSEAAVSSKDRKQQIRIYNRLKFIREAAEKTTGDKSDIAKTIAKIVKPVEDILKKKTGFGEFAKERIKTKLKALPETIVREIPLIGGMLGDFLSEKREQKEDVEQYAGERIEQISRAGKKRDSLYGILTGRRGAIRPNAIGGKFPPEATPPFAGATPVSDLMTGALPETRAGDMFRTEGLGGVIKESPTLGKISADIEKIKEILISKFEKGTDSLTETEKEIENQLAEKRKREDDKKALADTKKGPFGNLIDSIGKMFGFGGQPQGTAPSQGYGIGDMATDMIIDEGISRVGKSRAGRGIVSGAKNMMSRGWKGAKNLVGGAWQGTKNLAGGAWQGAKSMLGFGGGGASTATTAVAEGASSTVANTASTAAKSGTSWFGKMVGGAKNLASSAWQGTKNLASGAIESIKALSPAKQITKVVGGAARGIAKVVMSAPVLGGIIAAIMQGAEIKSVIDDPNLPVEEKKEKVGVGIMKLLGAAGGAALGTWLGGAGGAALGSVVPVLGTAAGGWLGSLIGALGGEWVGKTLLGALGESLGGKEIYDIAASVPGISSLISIPEDKKTTDSSKAGTKGVITDQTADQKIKPSQPATPNTTVGQQVRALESERSGAETAKAQAAQTQQMKMYSGGVAGGARMSSNISNQTNTTVNNYNDDIRIRNNEPSLKRMEQSIL